MYTVCNRSGGQINTFRKVPLQVNFLDDDILLWFLIVHSFDHPDDRCTLCTITGKLARKSRLQVVVIYSTGNSLERGWLPPTRTCGRDILFLVPSPVQPPPSALASTPCFSLHPQHLYVRTPSLMPSAFVLPD